MQIKKVRVGYGYKVIQDNEVVGYYGEYADNGASEGVIFKDYEAFELGEGVCYINEYGFDNSEQNSCELFEFNAKQIATENGVVDNPYFATGGYTKQDFINLAGGDLKLAEALFDSVGWECPETLLDQWEIDVEV